MVSQYICQSFEVESKPHMPRVKSGKTSKGALLLIVSLYPICFMRELLFNFT